MSNKLLARNRAVELDRLRAIDRDKTRYIKGLKDVIKRLRSDLLIAKRDEAFFDEVRNNLGLCPFCGQKHVVTCEVWEADQ